MRKFKKKFLLSTLPFLMFSSCYVEEDDNDIIEKEQGQTEDDGNKQGNTPKDDSGDPTQPIHIDPEPEPEPQPDESNTLMSVLYKENSNEETEELTFNELLEQQLVFINNGELTTVPTFLYRIKEFNIPSDQNITSLNPNSLSSNTLTKVALPEGITELGSSLFASSQNLESLYLPSTITSINTNAFSTSNENLKYITVSNKNPIFNSRNNCNAIIQTDLNKVVLFTKHSTLIEGIKTFEDGSYINQSISTLSLPSTVESFPVNCLTNCESVDNIVVAANNPHFLSSNNGSSLVTTSGKLVLASNSIPNTLPSTITSIGTRAFYYLKNKESITIPSTVTSFDNNALQILDNSIVGNFIFQSNINNFASSTFQNARTNIVIDSNITEIGTELFSSSSITSITIPSSVTSINTKAFSKCRSLSSVTFSGAGLTSLGDNVFEDCEQLTTFSCPSTLKSIGLKCFHHSKVASLTLNDSIETISDYAFANTQITSITLPNSIKKLGASAFNSSQLQNLVIPGNIEIFEERVFGTNFPLTSVEIKSGLTAIPISTFEYCRALKQVSIPKSVTSIGNNAFSGCSDDLLVTYAGTKQEWESISGYLASGIKKVKMSDNQTYTY